jgi:predicted aspartyl protease
VRPRWLIVWLQVAIVHLASAQPTSAQVTRPVSVGPNGLIATIPFAPDAGHAIFVSVGINGQAPQWWAVDTGSSECIVDRRLARKIGLAMRGSRPAHGAGKGTVRLDSIKGKVRLDLTTQQIPTCDHFAAIDLSGSATASRPIAGILGYEFFARYVVRIDFGAHTLQLYDSAKFRYAGRGDTVALTMERNIPRVAVRIRTARRPEITRQLIVDTGSEDAVDDSSVRRSSRSDPITVATTGLGKSYEAVIGTLDTVRIGRSLFTNVPGVAADVGIVGNGIWSRFVSIFDLGRRRVYLEPNH